MTHLDTTISPPRADRADGLTRSLKLWWGSCQTSCERTALVLLTLICLTTIYSTAIVQILVVTQTLVVIWCIDSLPLGAIRRTPLDIPYAVFLLGRVVSVVLSEDPGKSLPAISVEFFFYIVFFLVTQAIRGREVDAARVLVSIFIWAGVVAGAIGIVKVYLSFDARASSTTAGTYTLGTYLCPVLCLALLAPYFAGKIRVWKWVPPLIICLGIVFTFDRLHWIAMALILTVAGIISPRRRLTFALFALLAASLLIPSIRVRALQMANLEVLMTGRDVLWRGAMLLSAKHPFFGFGPRTFTEIFPYFELLPDRGVGSWHNDYLQVYMESGLAGLLPLLWLLTVTIVYSWRLLRSRLLSHEVRRLVLSLLVAVSLIFLIGGVLDTLVGILFRILLGLLALLLGSANDSLSVAKRSLESSAPPFTEPESVT